MLSAPTPPDGMNDIPVNGAASALIAAGPPSSPAGKNFTSSSPRFNAVISSDAVATPGRAGTPARGTRHDVDRQAGADDEPGTGIHHLIDMIGVQYGPCPDVQAGQALSGGDGIKPGRGAQGDLGDGDAAGQQRLAEGKRLLRFEDNDRERVGTGSAGTVRSWCAHSCGVNGGFIARHPRRSSWSASSSRVGRPSQSPRSPADGAAEGVAHPQTLGRPRSRRAR